MKTSGLRVIAATAACLLLTGVATAKNGGNGGNQGGAFKVSFGNGGASNHGVGITLGNGYSNNNHSRHINSGNNYYSSNYGGYNGGYQSCHSGGYGGYVGNYNGGYESGQVSYTGQVDAGQAFEPFHNSYVVLPGDSFYTVSLKEYATSANARHIARFNNLPPTAALSPGQVLKLPSISASGKLSPSRAPAADELSATTASVTAANPTSAGSNVPATVTPAEAPRPQVNVGSTLLVDGQTFGEKPGAARLRVGGVALKIEIVEWKSDAVKIRLPQLDLASAANADIEIVRADGSLAAKSGIELTAATEVAAAQ